MISSFAHTLQPGNAAWRKASALAIMLLLMTCSARPNTLYVAPSGADTNPGTLESPFATLQMARDKARVMVGKSSLQIILRAGTYYLPDTLVLTGSDSGTEAAPVTYQSFPGETAILSGGEKLSLKWTPYQGGIMQAQAPADLHTDQLFINGKRQILARYPNYYPGVKIFDGFAPDALSKERVARWADPAGGFFHAMHPALWGDFTWMITGKDSQGNATLSGGWQNNRGGGPHLKYRFVENIFEELDAPREWYLNPKTHILYYYPPAGLDLPSATVEAVRLESLVAFRGSQAQPVKNISFEGIEFRHAARTFMKTREKLLRTDWAIYRGGAVLFEGTENCSLKQCVLDQLGGTAVFVNGYNRHLAIQRCRISEAGANGIAFIGDQKAARSALFNYGQSQKLEAIDRVPGPATSDYPADCLVDDCLIYHTGRFEKQTAGVEIDLAQSITVRHCSIYDVPRAGINIGDGCWGGHVIEYCDIFDTVEETGDHGSFNSWGRDRYWMPGIPEIDARVGQVPDLPFLDVVKPITLRNSRWRCDHGWDIDLDDGSSNYQIYNNLCLNGGIKNREGFRRIVRNNITVNNSYYPQLWPRNSGDIVESNIFWGSYRSVRMTPPWGQHMDQNFIQNSKIIPPRPATALQVSGGDLHSLEGDAQFIDPAAGDYRVRDTSPVLALGFRNFPMDQFGVQDPALRKMARTPRLAGIVGQKNHG